MRRLLTAVILLLVAGSALADSNAITSAAGFASTLTPSGTDYSVAYLSQIFGTVGNVLQGTSGQILGKVFEIFNKGLLVVAAIYLGVVTVQTLLRAGNEGSFMGQNRSVPLLFLRIAMGFALIVPSSTTGYSLLQDFYMKIVVEGVGLADQVWDAGLHYMQYGGELYIQPKNLSTDSQFIPNMLGSVPVSTTTFPTQQAPLPVVTQIFQDLVCTIKSSDWEKAQNPGTHPQSFQPVFSSSSNGYVYFPGVGNDPNAGPDKYAPSNYPYSGALATPACGYVADYFFVGGAPGIADGGKLEAMKSISYQALKQLVISLEPAAQSYVNQVDASNPVDPVGHANNNVKQVFSAILAYGNLITPYQQMLNVSASTAAIPAAQAAANAANAGAQCYKGTYIGPNCSSQYAPSVLSFGIFSGCEPCHLSASNFLTPEEISRLTHKERLGFIPQAEAQGWIMAGSFYWNVELSNESLAKQSIGQLLPKAFPPTTPIFSLNINPSPSTYLMNSANAVISYKSCPVTNNQSGCNLHTSISGGGITYLWEQYVNAQHTSSDMQQLAIGSGGSADIGSLQSDIINSGLGALGGSAFNLTGQEDYNPITVLMNEGNALLKAVSVLWIAAISISAGIAVAAGICDSSSPGGVIFNAVLTWVKSIIMLLTSLMLLPGAILAYYIPLYPFTIFTFAAIGWFLLVVEGMAAAPLVCLGMTHPEGHDFLGKAEQAMMLFLSIFIRPALMIIGLLGSMVISFVAFHMLIVGFAGVISSIMNTGADYNTGAHGVIAFQNMGSTGNKLLELMKNVLVMVVFGMLAMEVVEQCYKLIFQLPNQIMLWIGGPQTGQDVTQSTQALKTGISGAAGGMKEAGSGVVGATDSAGKEITEGKRHAKKGDDSGDITGGG